PFERVRQNVLGLLGGERPFVGLDIETDVRTKRILNVAATRYEQTAAGLERTAAIDLARPAFWSQDEARRRPGERLRRLRRGEAVTGAVITKAGQEVAIGGVVRGERELIREAARFLAQHEGAVLGHNIGFDLGTLLERAEKLGMAAEVTTL